MMKQDSTKIHLHVAYSTKFNCVIKINLPCKIIFQILHQRALKNIFLKHDSNFKIEIM